MNQSSHAEVSAIEPDWSRENKQLWHWSPGRSLLASLRCYQSNQLLSNNPFRRFVSVLAIVRHRFWSVIAGADIPLNATIGGGLLIPHPNGIVIHPGARIGPNCLIFQQVTIGAVGSDVPTIGGHVDFGAGAKVLGAISVGDHARVGANAVVLIDVPPGWSAVGVPARLLPPRA